MWFEKCSTGVAKKQMPYKLSEITPSGVSEVTSVHYNGGKVVFQGYTNA